MDLSSAGDLSRASDRSALIRSLRSALPSLDGSTAGGPALAFQLQDLDERLLHRGLAAGALHEIAPVRAEDMPAALGFAAACLARGMRRSPSLLIFPAGYVRAFGGPYAHGLHGLGLDPGSLVVFRAESHKAALWAAEEALRSRSLAFVLAVLTGGLDLKASRRLHLAASSSETFLMVLTPAHAEPAGAALSRWRIGPAPSERDRFGAFARFRWEVTLERSRNGRTGSWILEWDHVAYRFRLAGTLADHASPPGPGLGGPGLRRAG
jgi:protein ImuA